MNSDDMKDKLIKAGKKVAQLRIAKSKEITDDLTDDQLAIWKELIGKKFVFRTQR